MGKLHERERQQRRKYYKHMEEQRATEGERIRAMEMLLDAKWTGAYFLQTKMCGNFHTRCYYNKKGEVIPRGEAMNFVNRLYLNEKG